MKKVIIKLPILLFVMFLIVGQFSVDNTVDPLVGSPWIVPK
ncbi:hypothetical protein [Paenibacillus sp. 481]|nr:hypothetical protein [Paenibacillus sp. 481]